MNGEPKAEAGRVYVNVSGLTGTGKSAVMGEIEIALKALGLTVEHGLDFQAEKNATHADWQEALDLYKPVVVLSETNVSRAITPAPSGVRERAVEAIRNAFVPYLPDGDWSGHIASVADAILSSFQGGAQPVACHEEAVALRQARYVLRDLHAKDSGCGYGKLAEACERAADRFFAHPSPEQAGEVERLRGEVDCLTDSLAQCESNSDRLITRLWSAENSLADLKAEQALDREAIEGIADDYMTSEKHHPDHVLIPTAKFEAIRARLSKGSKDV